MGERSYRRVPAWDLNSGLFVLSLTSKVSAAVRAAAIFATAVCATAMCATAVRTAAVCSAVPASGASASVPATVPAGGAAHAANVAPSQGAKQELLTL